MARKKTSGRFGSADKRAAAGTTDDASSSGIERNTEGTSEEAGAGGSASGWTAGKSIVALTATLATVAVAYLGYDLLRGQINECETIFQQSQTSIQANLEIIKSKGALVVGPKKIQNLSERAMNTAVTLKACCVKLEPEGFLQCQANVSRFEDKLQQVASSVAKATETTGGSGKAEAVAAQQEVIARVNDANQESQTVQERFIAISKAAAATVTEAEPGFVAAESAEIEPNNEVWEANLIPLGALIEASVSDGEDSDYFKFTTLPVHRDWYSIKVENRSNSLQTRFRLLDGDKNELLEIGGWEAPTVGGDVTRWFVARPDKDYYVQVWNFDKTAGSYALRVSAGKSYDAYEPNDSILEATVLDAGVAIEAGIMDRGDEDYYSFETGDGVERVRIDVKNRSDEWIPWFRVLDGSKNEIYRVPGYEEPSPGADLSRSVDVRPGAGYFVHVGKFEKTRGDYQLLVVGE